MSTPTIAYLEAVKDHLIDGMVRSGSPFDPRPFNTGPQRAELVRKYSWSIPTHEALSAIVSFASSIVEIGAGTGYWASLLQAMGADVLCFDQCPPGVEPNPYSHVVQWAPIQQGKEEKAGQSPERALMLSWPPYDTPMAHFALHSYLDAGGKKLIFIGESWGGCTGNDAFFTLRDAKMREVKHVDLPQWYGLHDALWLFETT